MKRLLFLALTMFTLNAVRCQNPTMQRPKLVVGIVVDQMRWDYLSAYESKFGNDGFRRLMREGCNCDNTMINYIPTVTACGHSSIYTGSTPAITGIAGNDFYVNGKRTYCTDDTVKTVGSATKAGMMSPRHLLVTTMCDALRLATDFKSEVIGISLKDRGAILPAGHTANAAYWYDKESCSFITSTYYMKALPEWVNSFNRTHKSKDSRDIRYLPDGNTLTARMAMAAVDGEHLGQKGETDFLAVSFSATDYIGHKYGTKAPQTEEAYVSLDKDLAALLNYLDAKVGKGNYLLFLTADHGASHNAGYLADKGIPAGEWDEDAEKKKMNEYLQGVYGAKGIVKDIIEYRIYLDDDVLKAAGKTKEDVETTLCDYLNSDERIAYALSYAKAALAPIPDAIRNRIIMGYHPKRSGDIQLIPATGYYKYGSDSFHAGTTHGVWNPYDSHIPLIFFGWNVAPGHHVAPCHITDIAPTVCALLHIQQPNGCVGDCLPMVIQNLNQ